MRALLTIILTPFLALTATFGVVTLTHDSASAQAAYGCDEAYHYTRSAGAQACREAGWTVLPRLVVSPRGWVHMSTLPHCRNEDGSGQRSACTWNLGPGIDGNGIGRILWIDRADRVHYVRGWAHTTEGEGH